MKALTAMTGDSLEGIIDYKVVDQNGENIGSLHSLWSDPATGAVEFLGVKTGWLFGHNHVVPADRAELDEKISAVRLPYAEAFIKEAPSISADSEISETEEASIYAYYRGETAPPSPVLPDDTAFPAGDALSGARAVSETTASANPERWRRIGGGASVNPDPVSGEPGAHPVGVGAGAAAGGVSGAAIGAVGGPIGSAVGAVAGTIGGGLVGKGVAEAVDPTAKDA